MGDILNLSLIPKTEAVDSQSQRVSCNYKHPQPRLHDARAPLFTLMVLSDGDSLTSYQLRGRDCESHPGAMHRRLISPAPGHGKHLGISPKPEPIPGARANSGTGPNSESRCQFQEAESILEPIGESAPISGAGANSRRRCQSWSRSQLWRIGGE